MDGDHVRNYSIKNFWGCEVTIIPIATIDRNKHYRAAEEQESYLIVSGPTNTQ